MARTYQLIKGFQSHTNMPKVGDKVRNTNPGCIHYKSEGFVTGIKDIPGGKGKTISYRCTNDGSMWRAGDILQKTPDQLSPRKILGRAPARGRKMATVIGESHLGAIGIAGHTRGTLQPGANMASDSGMIFWSPTYGSMNPIGSSVGRTHLGATVIGNSGQGGWDSWQNAGMMDSSFGYGSPTALGAIGMAGIPAGTLIPPQGGLYPRYPRAKRHIKRGPTQLWDIITGKARRR